MRKPYGLLLIVPIVVWLGAPADANDPVVPEALRPVRAYIQEAVRTKQVPSIGVAVVQDDKVAWMEAFGIADLERGTPATPDTIYRLASISKTFTATGVMMLVDRGLIDLDRPANAYLPGRKLRAYVGDANEITIRRMLNHTSGLPEAYNNFYYEAPVPSWDETIRRYGFAFVRPGTRRVYSNYAMGFLSYIAEVVAEKPWTTFIETDMLDPIGMRRTSTRVRPGRDGDAAGQYHIAADGRFMRVPDWAPDQLGSGGVRSSLSDMTRWMRLHLNGGTVDGVRVLKSETSALMRRADHEDIEPSERITGLGWGVESFLGQRSFAHAGGGPGTATQVRAFPEQRSAFVLLTNAGAHDLVADISLRLSRALVREGTEPIKAPSPTPLTATAAKKSPGATRGTWTGTLLHPDGDIALRLEVGADGSTTIAFGGQRPQPLTKVTATETRLDGLIDALIPTQAGYPGVPQLSFQLERDGDRLQGLCKAYAYRWFGLPFWVTLSRVEPSR